MTRAIRLTTSVPRPRVTLALIAAIGALLVVVVAEVLLLAN